MRVHRYHVQTSYVLESTVALQHNIWRWNMKTSISLAVWSALTNFQHRQDAKLSIRLRAMIATGKLALLFLLRSIIACDACVKPVQLEQLRRTRTGVAWCNRQAYGTLHMTSGYAAHLAPLLLALALS